MHSVSQQVAEARQSNEGSDKNETLAATSDYSPSSDLSGEHKEEEGEEESDGNNNMANNVDNIDRDRDSLDEGLGDISSEGEVAESPQWGLSVAEFTKNDSIGDIVNTSRESQDCAQTKGESEEPSTNLYLDTEKERRPSRISFETPL